MAESQGKNERRSDSKPAREELSIVRIAGRDINGSFKLAKAFTCIKGIGSNMAIAITNALDRKYGLSPDTEIGSLDEATVAKVEEALKNPASMQVPTYMLNRRKDIEAGIDMHLIGNDLNIRTRQDIEYDIKIQSWRGFRHQYGQKVRGQRTRSTGRTGASIGVTKKKELPGGAATAGQQAAASQEKSAQQPSAPAKK
jgi:small subunit ribosomal protein S13